MKKAWIFPLTAILLLSVSSINAQNTAEFGIKGGVTLSNFGGDKIKDLDSKNANLGFIGGITLDLPIASNFYLFTGVEYVIKGAKYESKSGSASASLKLTPTYLQMPLHLGVKLPITDNTKVVLGVGPYFAYGIGGKVKGEGTAGGITYGDKTDFFGDNSFAKRFDVGAGINAGLEFGKLSFSLGYDLGFLNILNKNSDNLNNQFNDSSPSLRNQSAYLTVGVRF
ncbi:MAG: hypothetical protein BGN96_14370 [Bacteroidales bacterium 45-6]|nr:MAG: hypothetical protein BGN96_14370 [Bacteroidales bacterium 45-6]